MNPKMTLGRCAYEICLKTQIAMQSGDMQTITSQCDILIQEIQKRASDIYDSSYFGRKNMCLALKSLKKHVKPLGSSSTYQQIQYLHKLLKRRNHRNFGFNKVFEQLPDELNMKIASLFPVGGGSITKLKTLYGHQEQLFYELIMPIWIENQNLKTSDYISNSWYKQIAVNPTFSADQPIQVQSFNKLGLESKAMLSVLPFIRTINYIASQQFTDSALQTITQYNHPYNLKLAGCVQVTDLACQSICRLTKLQILAIQHTAITNKGIKRLRPLTNLRQLSLGSENIQDVGLRRITHLKQLRSLQLCCSMHITNRGFQNLTNLEGLTELMLSGCLKVSDEWFNSIGLLRDLQRLYINDAGFQTGPQVTDEGLKQLSTLTKLKMLELNYAFKNITPAGIKAFEPMRRLRRLELGADINLTNEGLQSIGLLTKLVKLELEDCSKIEGRGIRIFSNLRALRSLKLRNCSGFTGVEIHYLKHLPSLEKLSLCDSPHITDTMLIDLGILTNLTALDLEDCSRITCRGLKHLKTLRKLHSIVLSGCKRNTQAGFKELRYLPRLRCLHLNDVKIDDATITDITVLKDITELIFTTCHGNRANDFTTLKHMTNLKKITLQGKNYLHTMSDGNAHVWNF